MEAAGCEAWFPLEKLAVRGFVEVLAHLPELLRIRAQLRRRLLEERVPLFVGVDAPDFNLGLERKLKRAGVRTIHFVSPSVWAWRRERLASIGAQRATAMLALFPFEPPLYEEAGIPVTYVGHPLAQEAATHTTRRETRELLKLGAATPVFALLPGSRLSEIEMHASLVLDTAARCSTEARSDAQFLVPFVTRATRDAFENAHASYRPRSAADHAALRSRRGRAARRRRRASWRRAPPRSKRRSRAARTSSSIACHD